MCILFHLVGFLLIYPQDIFLYSMYCRFVMDGSTTSLLVNFCNRLSENALNLDASGVC